jgi:hypothetical protein
MAVNRILRATLALPFELGGDPQALDHYNEWLERTVLEPMRKMAPESYRAIVEYLKNFVLKSSNDGRTSRGEPIRPRYATRATAIRNLKPSGLRRSTPTSLFQQRQGHSHVNRG